MNESSDDSSRMAPLRSFSANFALILFLRTSASVLDLLFSFLNWKGNSEGGKLEFMNTDIWFLILVTSDGLLVDGFSFLGFCKPWKVKHKSLIQDMDVFVLITSLISSLRASAADILAPLGILPNSDKFALQVLR